MLKGSIVLRVRRRRSPEKGVSHGAERGRRRLLRLCATFGVGRPTTGGADMSFLQEERSFGEGVLGQEGAAEEGETGESVDAGRRA